MKNELKNWEKEKKLIPVMIRMYCKGNHKQKELCPECRELTEFALYRLDKCPFKTDKQPCTFCKIHCYKPDMREKIKKVMRYSGPRMIFTHPGFAFRHVALTIKHKREEKKNAG